MKFLIKTPNIILLILMFTHSLSYAIDSTLVSQEPYVLDVARYDRSKPFPELMKIMQQKKNSVNDVLNTPRNSPANILGYKKSDTKNKSKKSDFDKVINKVFLGSVTPDITISVDGISKNDIIDGTNLGMLPPDTNGDVGLQYYVQYINTNWAVFDKTTGDRVSDVFYGNSFWAGFGGYCESDNHGDPVVLFDKIAQVWVFTQFGEFSSADAAGGGFQCFAISDRADLMDPALTFYRYEYQFVGSLNDYPHLSIWNDVSGARSGYYMVTHDFSLPFVNAEFQQASFSVFERDAMLIGQPARFLRFTDTSHFGNSAYGSMPVHLESAVLAPAGMCAPFVTNDRNNSNQGYYSLWELCVDWNNIGMSTLSSPIKLNTEVVPFDYEGVNDVAQPSPAPAGSELSSLAGNTMYRASARAYPPGLGKPMELVLNHTLHGGDGIAGVTWAHIALTQDFSDGDIIFKHGFENGASTLNSPSIIQQGFYSPDNESRWMGAISLDQAGNIGLAYSTASNSTYPSVRYTGRETTDPLGQLRAEKSCVVGGGIQTWVDGSGRASRWGDYSSMSIDPVDQCTFWASIEYISETGNTNWNNRICSFRFDNCGEPDFGINSLTPKVINVCSLDADPIINLEVRAFGGFNSTVNLTSSGLINGATLNYDNNTLTSYPANQIATISNLATANVNSMTISVDASSTVPAISKSREFILDISLGTVGATNLQLPVNNSIDQSITPVLTWNLLANAEDYTVEIATDMAFTNIIETEVVQTNSYQTEVLLQATTQYYWRVTTSNHCGEGVVSSIFGFTTGVPGVCPTGTSDNIVFSEDVEGDTSAWTISHGTSPPPANIPTSADEWVVTSSMSNSGSNAFYAIAPEAGDEIHKTDQYLVSPPITLPDATQSPVTMSYWNFQALSNTGARCDDAGILEISTDGGVNFVKIKNSKMLTDRYDGITFHLVDISPFPSELSWCANSDAPEFGPQEMVSVVKLDQWEGQTVHFRFRLGTGPSTLFDDGGWWIDDIEVKGCN